MYQCVLKLCPGLRIVAGFGSVGVSQCFAAMPSAHIVAGFGFVGVSQLCNYV